MRFLMIATLCFFSALSTQAESEQIVEFVIVDGTGDKPWNTKETSIQAPMGSSIRFINEDSIPHRLHTNGAPCSHGPKIDPGAKWDCKVTKPFSAEKSGPIYDHYAGPKAEVWIEVIEKETQEY